MLFSDVWNENAALFERLMKIHSNPPILLWLKQRYTKKHVCKELLHTSQASISIATGRDV